MKTETVRVFSNRFRPFSSLDASVPLLSNLENLLHHELICYLETSIVMHRPCQHCHQLQVQTHPIPSASSDSPYGLGQILTQEVVRHPVTNTSVIL
jgi:hypothetical protein